MDLLEMPVKYQEYLASLPFKTCEYCGKQFKQKSENQKYCSPDCSKAVNRARSLQRGKLLPKKGARRFVCGYCGVEFIADRKRAFCSSKCRNKSYNLGRREKTAVHEERECRWCHCKFISSNDKQVYCSRNCSKKARRRIRGVKYRLSVNERLKICTEVDSTISLYALIKRDNNICKICGKPCDLYDYEMLEDGRRTYNDNYPSIDHIIPISKGGQHTWSNIQLAHFKCNRVKGDLYDGE